MNINPHRTKTMEPAVEYSTTVDTSRPFSSVKEAVAALGERLLVGQMYSSTPSPKPLSDSPSITTTSIIKREPSWRSISSSFKLEPEEEEEKINNNGNRLFDTIKKVEAELERTKREVEMLKERGSETEVALAKLNSELHKNMSKLAQAEATAADINKTVRFERENIDNREGGGEKIKRQTVGDIIMSSSLGENDHVFEARKKGISTKQKPIIPLVADFFFFFKRKTSSTTNQHHNHLYASPF